MGSKFAKFIGMSLVLALVFLAGLFLIYLFEEVASEGFEFLITGLAILAGMSWIIFRGPIGKSIGGMLDSSSGTDPMLSARVAELEDRLLEISLETQRFVEIEERLDFTERLLAQHTDPSVTAARKDEA